jgi:hypothetical protein
MVLFTPVNTCWFLLSIASLICGLILGVISTLAQIITVSWRASSDDVCILKRSEVIVCIVLQVVYMVCFSITALALYQSMDYSISGAGSSKDHDDDDNHEDDDDDSDNVIDMI